MAGRAVVDGVLALAACLVLLLVLTHPAGAQTLPADANAPSLSQEQLDDLVALLENPEQREQFLQHLKALSEAEQTVAETPGEPLSEALRLQERVGRFLERYIGTLEHLGLPSSTLGEVAMLGTAVIALALFVLLNNWLARVFDRKLSPLRTRFRLPRTRFSQLFAVQVWAGLALAALLLFYTLSQVYIDSLGQVLTEPLLLNVGETVLAAFVVILLFLIIWELSNAVMEFLGSRSRASTARVQTLLPLVRNLLLFVLVLFAGMVLLSELGINVMPLMAGAGVLGIAIGFGAQTLVKDFLTGFTIIAEDLVQIGDVVTVGGRTGEVTRLTIRKMELRSLEGTVYTVPFSEISVVDNLTKDYTYYMLNVGVAYREDTDEVIRCLEDIDAELREDPEFSHSILGPLEVLGVDNFGDSAVVIKARTRTRAHDKWYVGREFNRRIKYAFDERGIEIPFPHQTLYFGEQKSGKPQAAARQLFRGDEDEQAGD